MKREDIEKQLHNMVDSIFKDLLKYELIIHEKARDVYRSTGLGKAMAKFYIQFETMKVLH